MLPVGAELFHEDTEMERRTDMTKLITLIVIITSLLLRAMNSSQLSLMTRHWRLSQYILLLINATGL